MECGFLVDVKGVYGEERRVFMLLFGFYGKDVGYGVLRLGGRGRLCMVW